MLNPLRRPFTLGLVVATALTTTAFAHALDDGPAGAGEPVAGSVQDGYRPIRVPDAGSMPEEPANDSVELPEGTEPLSLQATYIGESALEPTLGVDREGRAFYAASTLVVETAVAWGGGETVTYRSTDGGATWENVQLTLPTDDSVPPANADPMVYVDEETDRVFNLDLYAGCSNVNFSDDAAESWTTSPVACGDFVNDHQTIIAGDEPPASTTPTIPTSTYTDDEGTPRWLYYCFNRVIDSNCGRSVDGGLTWTPTAEPAFYGYDPDNGGLCGGLHGHIDTDPDGRLLLPKGHCGTPWIGVSADGGDSWTRTRVSDIPTAGTHLSVASDTAGNYYFVWWDDEKRLPYLSISRDHGATWETPMMIAPPGVTEVNFPVIDAGTEGRIAISFPGSTDPDRSGGSRPWNHYVVVSADALAEQPLFLSATANDPADPIHRGNCNGRCGGLWDFQDTIVSPQGEAWAAVADACVDLCARQPGTATLRAGLGIAVRQLGGPDLRVEPAEG